MQLFFSITLCRHLDRHKAAYQVCCDSTRVISTIPAYSVALAPLLYRIYINPATMASPPADASPYSTLQYLHSWAEPHLPPAVNYIIVNGLKFLSSLPPSVANVVPLVIGAFVVYWLVMGALSTVRSTFRQSWFFLKWGTVAVVLAYGWAMMKGEQPMDSVNNNSILSSFLNSNHNPLNNGPLGGLVNQAARYAGLTNGNAQQPNLNTDDLMKSAYNNFVPYPLRMMGNVLGFNPAAAAAGADGNSKKKSNSRSKTRQQKEAEEKLQDTANVATEWLGGVFEKVSEALGDQKEDRWSESRNRRAGNR